MSLADELAAIIRPIVQAAMREALPPAPSQAEEDTPEYLSFARAGRLVDVSPKTIAAWVRRGWLRRYGPKGAERVRTGELRDLMAKDSAPGAVDFEARLRHARAKLR